MTQVNGILIVNKPKGITSHDVVDYVRKKFGFRKVGHSGTLDPMATGVLVVLLGKATKLSNKFINLDKEYYAELLLGSVTDTSDAEGKVIKNFPEALYKNLEKDDVERALDKLRGKIFQTPPMVSAIRFKGSRLYELARRGIEVPRQPRAVTIYKLELVNFSPPRLSLRVVCSKGTYIRKLCEDIGEILGCGAYQSQLCRLRVGEFAIDNAVSLDKLDESYIRNN